MSPRRLCRAAQTPARGIVLVGDVTGLHAGDLAGNELDTALAARAVAVAGRVDGDVGRFRGLQNGAAGRGGEFDLLRTVFELEGDFVHAVWVPFRQSVETAAGGIREVHLRRPLRGIHALYYKQIPLCGQALRGSKNFLYNFQKLSKNCAS